MASMTKRQTTPVRFPPGLTEQIDSTLSYGQSRNAWIVEACQMRLGSRWAQVGVQPSGGQQLAPNASMPPRGSGEAPPPSRGPVASFDPDEVTPDV